MSQVMLLLFGGKKKSLGAHDVATDLNNVILMSNKISLFFYPKKQKQKIVLEIARQIRLGTCCVD